MKIETMACDIRTETDSKALLKEARTAALKKEMRLRIGEIIRNKKNPSREKRIAAIQEQLKKDETRK